MNRLLLPALAVFFPLHAATFHVDPAASSPGDGSTWPAAFSDLQSAIAAATSGDEIWVAEGTYKPGATRGDSFDLPAGVEIYGGFPSGGGDETFAARNPDPFTNATVISGDIDDDGTLAGNSYHLVDARDSDSLSRLDGFTLTGGNADGGPEDDRGGAITIANRAPVLARLRFLENRAQYGGAIHTGGAGANATLTDCAFHGNIADIPGGSGGAIYLTNDAAPTLINVSFAGNHSLLGGAIRAFNSDPLAINCAFAANHGNNTGGFYGDGGSLPVLKNCIFWKNTSNAGGNGQINSTTFGAGSTSNLIQGVFGGSGIFYPADPLFIYQPVSPDGDWTLAADNQYGHLGLRPGSPFIDRGNNAANSAPSDAAGSARIVDAGLDGTPTIDLGPFEAPAAAASPAGEVHRWTFDGDTSDTLGNLELFLNGGAFLSDGQLVLNGTGAFAVTPAPSQLTLGERTFIAWVSPSRLDQAGGGVLTVSYIDPSLENFDGIVFGERVTRQWMNGSNSFNRSVINNGGPAETITSPGQVMIAIVYGPGNAITIYRNGSLYSTSGATTGSLYTYLSGQGFIRLGERHSTSTNPNRFFAGSIDEARIYNTALAAGDIASLAAAGPTPDIAPPAPATTAANLANGAIARQSDTVPVTFPDRTDAGIVIDGRTGSGNRNAAQPSVAEPSPWVEVELPEDAHIERVEIVNLTNTLTTTCCLARLRDITIELRDAAGGVLATSPLLNPENAGFTFPNGPGTLDHRFDSMTPARIIRVIRTPDPDLSGTGGLGSPAVHESGYLEFAELRIFGENVAAAPPVTAFSATYDSRRADPNPVAQLFYDTETAIGADNVPPDGLVNAPANAGIVIDGSEVVWQVNDQLTGADLNNPYFRRVLTPGDLGQLHDLGWTFTFEARAIAASGFVGWGFTAPNNPGWDIGANTAARVGFSIENNGGSLRLTATNGSTVQLPSGSAADFHTISAIGQPGETTYEWFIDGFSQGVLDFAENDVGGLTENNLSFGSGNSSAAGRVVNWKRVGLSSIPTPVAPSTEGLVFHLPFEPGPGGTETFVEKSQAPGSKPAVIPSVSGLITAELAGGTGHSLDFPAVSPARFLDASQALPALADLDTVTLSAWVKPDSSAKALFHFYKSDQTSVESLFRITSFSGVMNLWLRTRSGGTDFGENLAVPVPDIADGRWHHVAAVISPTRATIYYDGKVAASAPPENVTAFTSALSGLDRFDIASWTHPVGDRSLFRGGLDEVAIWNRALSDAEIAGLYQFGYLAGPLGRDADGDGLNHMEEANLGTSDRHTDSDGDGISDAAEVLAGTNPALTDSDGDGISDPDEESAGTNPLFADSDGDGFSDGEETLPVGLVGRGFELAPDGTVIVTFQAYGAATGLGLESSENLDSFAPLAAAIVPLGGGLHTATATPPSGHRFFRAVSAEGAATDPLDPTSFADITSPDSDGDGLSDAAEATLGTRPDLVDTDSDTYSDPVEILLGTDPLDPASHPGIIDSDGDGLTDAQETALGTRPDLADTDDDTFSDHAEVNAGSDPKSATSTPGGPLLTGENFIRLENGDVSFTFRVEGTPTNLRLQSSSDLDDFPDLPSAVITPLGDGRHTAIATPPPGHRFFRAAADGSGGTVTTIAVNFELAGGTATAGEGGTFLLPVAFSSPFTGYLGYRLTGITPQGTLLPTVIGGIPLTATSSADLALHLFNDLVAGPAARYTVTLTGNAGLVPGLDATFTVLVEDDDIVWDGTLGVRSEQLNFVLESLNDDNSTIRRLHARDDSSLLPRGTFPVAATFGPAAFTCTSGNIPLRRALAKFNVNPAIITRLHLQAADGQSGQSVTADEISGSATIDLSPAAGSPAALPATFNLQRRPPPPPSTDLNLSPSAP